jgi:DNA gyrase inhibitor GyrI
LVIFVLLGAIADLTLIGLSHDNPYLTPPDKLRFDFCVMIERVPSVSR